MKKQFKGNDICVVISEAYTHDTQMLLGSPEMAQQLTEEFKITRFFERKKDTIATVGWSPKKGVMGGHWYGWSHRAIASFATKRKAMEFAKSVA